MAYYLYLTEREKQLAYYLISGKSKRDGKICKRLGLRYKNYVNILRGLMAEVERVNKAKGR